MIKKLLILFISFFFFTATAQVGIGTTDPNPSAALHINSTTGGLLIPSMTFVQRNAITSPAVGLMIYQTNITPGYYYYTGTAWQPFTGDSKWIRAGNDIHNDNTGRVGVGTASPTAKLHILGAGTTLLNKDFENQTLSPMTSNGNQTWEVTNNPNEVFAGIWAARTRDAMGSNQLSNLRYTANLPSDGVISFSLRTSTENNWDWLTFYIDDVQIERWSGVTAYRTVAYPVSAGSHNFRWTYSKDGSGDGYDDRVAIDNVLITAGSGFRLQDGTQSAGYVLTSDGLGNASWSDPNAGSGSGNSLWTANGNRIYNSNSGNVGVGVNSPLHKLHVETNAGGTSALLAANTNTTSTNTYGVHGITHSVNQLGSAGVFGESVTVGPHEIGVRGGYYIWGAALAGIGWSTSPSDMPTTGNISGATNDMGVFGGVNFSTGIGVYGRNPSSSGQAGYFAGNLVTAGGTKNASVPTTQGNQLVYTMESPEIWFEDFGKSKLVNGRIHIQLDDMFQETVFVDAEHPFHVFLQEQGDSNGLYVVPDQDGRGFTVIEKQSGSSNIDFSYRITAKRRFFQDHRFGVDAIQPFENNLVKAEYVNPRPRDIESMKSLIAKDVQEKMVKVAEMDRLKEQQKQQSQQTQQMEIPMDKKNIVKEKE